LLRVSASASWSTSFAESSTANLNSPVTNSAVYTLFISLILYIFLN
jgi:hypothetical protein